MLKKVIKFILCGLQETNFPISYEEQSNTLINYERLIHGEGGQSEEKQKHGRRDHRARYKRLFPRDFVGPSSYTLQVKNIAPINQDAIIPNIRDNYTVTDKADGLRKLLYINSTGRIYLINTNMNVQFTGAVVANKTYFDTLLDGEHILHDKKGNFINLYAVFDIYFKNGKDIRGWRFTSTQDDDKSRLSTAKQFVNLLSSHATSTIKDVPLPIKIVTKKFYASTEELTIFDGCNLIMKNVDDDLFEYTTDGLIFTPSNTGAGMDRVGATGKPFKITWDLSFKWKPPEFNTIDFLITTKKTSSGTEEIGTIFQDGMATAQSEQLTQYKTIILRVGFDERKHGFVNPCENIINDDLPHPDNLDASEGYKPVPFVPTNPFDPDAKTARVIIKSDQNGNKKMYTEENEAMEDEIIVEFAYDMTKPNFWKWIPLRVRYDKTAEYRAGLKNYGNAYHVANSNWHSIHNPITAEMIRSGNNIPEELGDDDVYYNKVSGNTSTRALRDFHNLFVKKLLIMSVSSRGDTLIDYAAGKGGDLPKWISAKLSFVFGIDISRDNIENRLDGICARYLKYRKQFRSMPRGLFVNGNSGLNIKSGDAMVTDKGKKIVRAIFGEGPKDQEDLGLGVYKLYGKVNEGFNISSIQFALHYMFESEVTLQNFLRNVSECTKVGGYFIGTSYDGNVLFDRLQDLEADKSIVIREGDKTIWELTKRYSHEEFSADESCLGYAIDVYQESINKTFREYLVNYEYLTRLMENYGFSLLSKDEVKQLNLPGSIGGFGQLYNAMDKEVKRSRKKQNEYGQALNMSAGERQISFLNKYFIFKKNQNVDAETTLLSLVHETNEKSADVDDEKKSAVVDEPPPADTDDEKSVVVDDEKSVVVDDEKFVVVDDEKKPTIKKKSRRGRKLKLVT
jgi:hypothetical protein